ncbi:S8 family serine peptidase [Kribbella sandramycini]|uniref:S8 family serine peptidase n=1 Tax=Kribbella sandramycini TaxID=60450 RepID=A0A7Y4P3Y3_9ACTN|nr:S8 family serine peptidase [Kribbella sandramycini]MBB6566848.1 subtilisin family serine protease [Kribbella sandramycini]NOL44570.1 S8 family serine peptidase [Kribbella sandramycini]
MRKRPAIAVLAVAGLAVPGLHAEAAPPPAAGPQDVRVTLISGDTVRLHGGDPARQSIEPGPGRERIGFQAHRTKDHSYVIPADLTKAVADGRLDRRLFDVKGLIAAGYDDASTTEIPVIATYQGKAKRTVPANAEVTRQLAAVKGAALRIDKRKATADLGSATKIWLDGKRELNLEQSVPQIGAPAAWQAGFTGKGIKVAVLDTGIDATHPDLAGQVAGARDFTDTSADDAVGHGTHVASTIAGTGAASGGKYKGVAPEAKLYDGKVCATRSCPESAILAGMEWAANEVKATVVNISLGGPDGPEIDPLEDAVNRLTAQTGTLFVISAGNEGPKARTVGSPGSADAALTVGAVDKQDGPTPFSSQGPRVGDHAVKPDISAPGAGIVAAKAKNATIGRPVGDQYLNLSGTSMAAPHTAGAAALLAQQHPAWKATELKGALMGSAKPAADQTAFQQGAGRVDLTTAIKQTVIAEPGNISFGQATYPHTDDEPVTKPVTYRNLGDQPITLDLEASFTGPDGNPAPADAFQLSATSVTIPAGGTAAVQATSNTKHTGPDGLYSGRITATGGGQKVTVATGVDKAAESYQLTIQTIARDGKPSDGPLLLLDLATGEISYPETTGTLELTLPKGEYLIDQFQEFERGPEDWIFFELAAPQVKLDADRTIVLDARQAKPVLTSAPRAGATQAQSVIGYDRRLTDPDELGLATGLLNFRLGTAYTLSLGPKLPPEQLTGYVASQWALPDGAGRHRNTPYIYALADYQPGEFVTGYNRVPKPQDFAIIDSPIHLTSDREVGRTIVPVLPEVSGVWVRVFPLDAPRTVRQYVDRGAPQWFGEAIDFDADDNVVGYTASSPKTYQPGRNYHERWQAAAFGPRVAAATRTADKLQLLIGNRGDADGRFGNLWSDQAVSTLLRDGQEVTSSPSFGYAAATGLPAAKATYKFVTTGTQSLADFATKIELTATFTSSAQDTKLPISTVRFRPAVGLDNKVDRTKVTELPVLVDGAKSVKSLKVQVSGDGATWTEATVQRTAAGYRAVFPTPAGSSVALKAQVVDRDGNSTEQAVFDAYRIR